MGARLDNAKALYLEAIRDGDYAEAIAKYSGSRYTQHSTPVRDGVELTRFGGQVGYAAMPSPPRS